MGLARFEAAAKIVFSDESEMEFTPEQYAELVTLIMSDTCRACPKSMPSLAAKPKRVPKCKTTP